MTKAAKPTTVKYTESHDRLTLTTKFESGEKLRINMSRYRMSLSYTPSDVTAERGVTSNILNNLAKIEKKRNLSPVKLMDLAKQHLEKAKTLTDFSADFANLVK